MTIVHYFYCFNWLSQIKANSPCLVHYYDASFEVCIEISTEDMLTIKSLPTQFGKEPFFIYQRAFLSDLIR